MGEFCADMSPALAQGFAKMREPLMGISEKALPAVLPDIVTGRIGTSELFGVARDMWKDVYKPEGLRSAVSLFSPYNDRLINIQVQREIAMKELARLRKVGLIARSAFILFDKSHSAPNELAALNWGLGALKDSWNLSGGGILSKFYKEISLKADKFSSSEAMTQFAPTTDDEFRKFFFEKTQKILDSIHEGTMTRKEYHEIRKWGVRHIMNAYQLRGIYQYSVPVHQTFQYLEAIHAKMGDKHDELLAASAGGGGESEQIVKLGSSVLKRLTVYLARQEQALFPNKVSRILRVGAFNALQSRAGP